MEDQWCSMCGEDFVTSIVRQCNADDKTKKQLMHVIQVNECVLNGGICTPSLLTLQDEIQI